MISGADFRYRLWRRWKEENLVIEARDAAIVVCARGSSAGKAGAGRAMRVVEMLREAGVKLHYLRKTGQPHHPLYLPGDLVGRA